MTLVFLSRAIKTKWHEAFRSTLYFQIDKTIKRLGFQQQFIAKLRILIAILPLHYFQRTLQLKVGNW